MVRKRAEKQGGDTDTAMRRTLWLLIRTPKTWGPCIPIVAAWAKSGVRVWIMRRRLGISKKEAERLFRLYQLTGKYPDL